MMGDSDAVAYAVVVDIPRLNDKCFIAFPFAVEKGREHPITEVIDKAVRQEKMNTFWINWEPPGIQIVDTIYSEIKGAKMLIAVCTEQGKTNPNVMYELGLADAIGKPTLMMATGDVPFDVQGKKVFTYSETELNNPESCKALVLRLRTSIRDVLNRVPSDTPGIHLIRTENRLAIQPVFWEYAKAAFQIAHTFRDEAQALIPHLNRLGEIARTLLAKDSAADELIFFLDKWHDYRSLHTNRMQPNLEEHEERCNNVIKYLDNLTNTEARNMASALRSDFDKLCSGVTEYKASYAEANKRVEEVQARRGQSAALYSAIDPLEQKAQNLINYANSLIRKLIMVIYNLFNVSH